MTTLSIDKGGWSRDAYASLEQSMDLSLVAKGWRARKLRRQLPLLAHARRAVAEHRTVTPEEGEFSLMTALLLPSFHRVFIAGVSRGFAVSWEDVEGSLVIHLRLRVAGSET
jgi:hypothetical protein